MSTTARAPVENTQTPPASPTSEANTRAHGRFAGQLPNLAVIALLAGVFYLGQRWEWKVPKTSELFGVAPRAAGDWCQEHLVPGSQCVECKPELLARPPEHGFCHKHGVAECVQCHPELAHVKGEPQLPRYDTQQAISLVNRFENNSRNMLHKRRVQFASAETADKAGIDVDVVQQWPMTEAVNANGELVFDPTRVAHLAPRAGGTIVWVARQVGDKVEPDEILAIVDAVQVGQAKSQLLQAIVQRQVRKLNYERVRDAAGGVSGKQIAEAEASLEEAEVALISARQTLVNLGLEVPEEFDEPSAKKIADQLHYFGIPSDVLAALPAATRSANLIPIRAPHAGVVVAADRVAGEVVAPTDSLFTVADPTRMWLTLNVRQEDASYVSRGQQVVFRTDDGSREVSGPISWISSTVDERTRTLQVRVNLANPDGKLKDRTFGTGRIILRSEEHAIAVPASALQSTADAQFVFVRDRNYLTAGSPKVFHVRQVRTGARDGEYVELLAGVLPGEVVATTGSPALLAQLLRGDLGAACGCHDK